jgi:aspartate ammonia-lyase
VNIVKRLRKETGQRFFPSHRKMLHTSHMTVFQHYSNALSELSSDLLIWINDWVILGSDPFAGMGEIHLPEAEPGSSIMPAKVNPSILEALKMAVLQVQGNNETIRLSCESTQLELNVMTPVMASNLFESQGLLTNGLKMFREKCLKHVQPTARMHELLDASMSTATALNPYLGYDVVAFLVKKSMTAHTPLEKLVQTMGILLPHEAHILLRAEKLTSPQKIDGKLRNTIHQRPAFRAIRSALQKYSR